MECCGGKYDLVLPKAVYPPNWDDRNVVEEAIIGAALHQAQI